MAITTKQKAQYIFTPNSEDSSDPDYMRETTDDATVSAWIAELLAYIPSAPAGVFSDWERGFCKGMAKQRPPFTGHQIVLVRRYYKRLIEAHAQSLKASAV